MRYQTSIRFLLFIFTAALISGCDDNNNSRPDALSCEGNRVWDFGDSAVIANPGAISLISESNGDRYPESKFPCAVLWEYLPSASCSLKFTYEGWLQEFNIPDALADLEISGANLVTIDDEGGRLTGTPANVSLTDLDNLPDCEFE